MGVKVHKEGESCWPLELCCFCRTQTKFWTKTDVACCEKCAARADEGDVPSKAVWFRRERIAMGRS